MSILANRVVVLLFVLTATFNSAFGSVLDPELPEKDSAHDLALSEDAVNDPVLSRTIDILLDDPCLPQANSYNLTVALGNGNSQRDYIKVMARIGYDVLKRHKEDKIKTVNEALTTAADPDPKTYVKTSKVREENATKPYRRTDIKEAAPNPGTCVVAISFVMPHRGRAQDHTIAYWYQGTDLMLNCCRGPRDCPIDSVTLNVWTHSYLRLCPLFDSTVETLTTELYGAGGFSELVFWITVGRIRNDPAWICAASGDIFRSWDRSEDAHVPDMMERGGEILNEYSENTGVVKGLSDCKGVIPDAGTCILRIHLGMEVDGKFASILCYYWHNHLMVSCRKMGSPDVILDCTLHWLSNHWYGWYERAMAIFGNRYFDETIRDMQEEFPTSAGIGEVIRQLVQHQEPVPGWVIQARKIKCTDDGITTCIPALAFEHGEHKFCMSIHGRLIHYGQYPASRRRPLVRSLGRLIKL